MNFSMENQTPSTPAKWIMPVSIIAVIVVVAVALYAPKPESTMMPATEQTTGEAAGGTRLTDGEQPAVVGVYQDGKYEAMGKYMSPGGEREVAVSLTLADGVVTDASFEGFATDPTSQRFQGEFAEGYQAMVVGRTLDELNLQKVSGSSLTPKGFMDAVQSIKQQAQS